MFAYTTFFNKEMFFAIVLLFIVFINNIFAENYNTNKSNLDDVVDLLQYQDSIRNKKLPLESSGQLQISAGFLTAIFPHSLTNYSFTESASYFLQINPFYKLNILDKLDIRFEIIQNISGSNMFYADSNTYGNLNQPYFPVYSGINLDLIYNFIKKDFLTLYTGYAIHSQYDTAFYNDDIPCYASMGMNSFFVGSNIYVIPNIFLVLEYRIVSADYEGITYNSSYWNMGVVYKLPISN